MVLGEVLTWLLLRSQGNDLGGDQAHYLIAGQALSHLSLHPAPEYSRDFLTHFIYRWPHGATVTDYSVVQTYPGPHGSVFAHPIGLPLLLSPFLAVGSVPFALLGLFTITAAGLVSIHQRASRLAGLGGQGQVVFALALAAPALWLASTQIYPDLVSGVLLAAALVEIALVERHRHLSRYGAAVIALSLAFVPWLQIKNLAPALSCAVAAAVVIRRLGPERRLLFAMAAVVVAGLLLLLAYNQYFFAHLVGLPQPNPTFTLDSASRVLALVFDRHQGLLVQVPTVILGLLGLWVARRTVPWAAGAAAAGSLAMLVINGTYTSDVPFGGVALAGRFEWSVVPLLLAWAPFLLARLQIHRARLIGVGVAVAALWLAQGVPILRGDHVYVNATFAPFAPWDPALYPGWWPGSGQDLPDFLPHALHLGTTWSHLLCEVLVAGGLALVLGQLARPEPVRLAGLAATLAALAVVAVLVVAWAPVLQPRSSLSWPGTVLGAPWSGPSRGAAFPPVPLVDVGPGTYRATLTYAGAPGATGAVASLVATPEERSVVSHWWTPAHPTDAALLSVTAPALDLAAAHTADVPLRPSAAPSARQHRATIFITTASDSVLSFRMEVHPGSTYGATSLRLVKVAP